MAARLQSALGEKDERILIDGQKKRPEINKKKTKRQSQKAENIDLICMQNIQDAARCPL